jgi:hypothetical protein
VKAFGSMKFAAVESDLTMVRRKFDCDKGIGEQWISRTDGYFHGAC